jgi:hypothetical protein
MNSDVKSHTAKRHVSAELTTTFETLRGCGYVRMLGYIPNCTSSRISPRHPPTPYIHRTLPPANNLDTYKPGKTGPNQACLHMSCSRCGWPPPPAITRLLPLHLRPSPPPGTLRLSAGGGNTSVQADAHPVWKWHRVEVLPAAGTWCEAPVRERPLHPKPTKRIYSSRYNTRGKGQRSTTGARGTEERLTHKAAGLRGSVEGLNAIESPMQRLSRTCSLELPRKRNAR